MVYKKLCKLEKIKSQPQAEKKKKKITNKYHINKDHNPITTHHKTPFTIDYTQFGVGRDSNCPTWDVLQRPDFQTTKLNFLLTIRPPSDHNFFFFFSFQKNTNIYWNNWKDVHHFIFLFGHCHCHRVLKKQKRLLEGKVQSVPFK